MLINRNWTLERRFRATESRRTGSELAGDAELERRSQLIRHRAGGATKARPTRPPGFGALESRPPARTAAARRQLAGERVISLGWLFNVGERAGGRATLTICAARRTASINQTRRPLIRVNFAPLRSPVTQPARCAQVVSPSVRAREPASRIGRTGRVSLASRANSADSGSPAGPQLAAATQRARQRSLGAQWPALLTVSSAAAINHAPHKSNTSAAKRSLVLRACSRSALKQNQPHLNKQPRSQSYANKRRHANRALRPTKPIQNPYKSRTRASNSLDKRVRRSSANI